MYLKHTEVLPIEPEEEGQKQQCKVDLHYGWEKIKTFLLTKSKGEGLLTKQETLIYLRLNDQLVTYCVYEFNGLMQSLLDSKNSKVLHLSLSL